MKPDLGRNSIQEVTENQSISNKLSNYYSMQPDEVDVMYQDQELTMSKFLKNNEDLQNHNTVKEHRDIMSDDNVIKLGNNKIFSFQNEDQQLINGLALTLQNKIGPRKN